MAKVEPITETTPWSPQAALIDAMGEVDDMETVLVIYTTKESGRQCYVGGGNFSKKDVLWMLEREKQRLLESD